MTQEYPAAPAGRRRHGWTTSPESRRTSAESPRRRVLKEGKLIFGQAHSVVDCTIDNMSDGGAHVRMTSSHGVPEDFYLVEANSGIIHKAEVAWRTTDGHGPEDRSGRSRMSRRAKPCCANSGAAEARVSRQRARGWAGAAGPRAS